MQPRFPLRIRLRGPLLLAAALYTAAGVPATASGQRAVLNEVTRSTVLDNGLEVIAVRNAAIPVATAELVFRTGAFTQQQDVEEGLPHLLEHMLFKTYGESSGRDWAYWAGELNAGYNGTTGDEGVTYYLYLPSENLERGLERLGDLVRSPRFNTEALTAEKQVVRGELERMASDPYFLQDFITDLLLWGPEFRRKNAIGNLMTILGATTDRLRSHYDRYYVPNNAALVVTGDVDADEVFGAAREHLGSWERGEDPLRDFQGPRIRPLAADTVTVIEADASDVTFTIKWQGPRADEDPAGTYAADLFTGIVNLPISGMQRRLVDTGLFQAVSMSHLTRNHVGPVSLTARTTPDRLEAAAAALREEVERFAADDYFAEAEAEAARRMLRVDAAFQLESATSLAHVIARAWSTSGLEYYLDYVDRVDACTVEDVRAFVGRYLDGRPRVVGLLASSEVRSSRAREIEQALNLWRTP